MNYERGNHFQSLATLQFAERFFGLENGQGTIQPAGVNFFVDLHAFVLLDVGRHAGNTPVDK